MAVVTIARQIGSGGSDIAYRLADELGYVVLDKNSVEEALQQAEVLRRRGDAAMARHDDSGIDEDTVQTVTSHVIAEMRRMTAPAMAVEEAVNWPEHYWHPRWDPVRYMNFLHALITEAAEQDHVIILGRGANFVLRDRPNVVRVFIGGSVDRRVKRLAEENSLNLRRAADIVARSDELRAAFVRKAFRTEWSDPANYDLVFDTDSLESDAILKRIAAKVRELDPTTFSTTRPAHLTDEEAKLLH